MKVNRERALVIVTLSAVAIAYCELLQTMDNGRTNKELRDMASDSRRANDYLVRATALRKHWWQR